MADRIVSLAPSATVTIHALDAADRLIGDTGDTASSPFGGWLTPDIEAVSELDPDLVITTDPLQAPIASSLRGHHVPCAHFEPATLEDMFQYIKDIAALVEKADTGETLVASLHDRIKEVQSAVSGKDRPVVYCEEWQTPPMVAGNWVPDVITCAGGRYPFIKPGNRSRKVTQSEVEAHDPEHVFLHICGFHGDVSPESMRSRGWELAALSNDNVTVLDDSVLNQPSPRLVDGIEQIASIVHPDAVDWVKDE